MNNKSVIPFYRQSHRFPNPRYFLANCNKWVDIIDTYLHNIDPDVVYLKKRVCSVQFTENDRSPGTNRLKCNFILTLKLPVILSNPDTPKSTVVAKPSVDLDLC